MGLLGNREACAVRAGFDGGGGRDLFYGGGLFRREPGYVGDTSCNVNFMAGFKGNVALSGSGWMGNLFMYRSVALAWAEGGCYLRRDICGNELAGVSKIPEEKF